VRVPLSTCGGHGLQERSQMSVHFLIDHLPSYTWELPSVPEEAQHLN
jgi:hypothetical protein